MMKKISNYNRFSILSILLFSILTMNTSWAQCATAVYVNPIGVNDVTTTSVLVNWDAVSPLTGLDYEWQIRTAGIPDDGSTVASGFVKSGNAPNSTTTITVSGLEFDTQYSFYMRYRCNASTNSPWQPLNTTTFRTKELAVPVATAAILVKTTSFIAKWNPVPGASYYRLDVYTIDPLFPLVKNMVGIYNNLQVNAIYQQVSGLTLSTQYFYQVRAVGLKDAVETTTADSNQIEVNTPPADVTEAIWTGTWSSPPNASKNVIIRANYDTRINVLSPFPPSTTGASFSCKSLTIDPGYTLTIRSANTGTAYRSVTVNGPIINNGGAVGIRVETSGNLIQSDGTNDIINVGDDIIVERDSNSLWRLDYTMWSSPVISSETLQEFSPVTLPNRFFSYDTSTDKFKAINSNTIFTPGAGYLIRMPDDWVSNPALASPITPSGPSEPYPGFFKGLPNADNFTVDISTSKDGYNMVGNPYPSTLIGTEFVSQNTAAIESTLWFWRRTNDMTGAGATNAFYATWTALGGTGVTAATSPEPGGVVSSVPNGKISKGQGFLVKAKSGATTLAFNNSQRIPTPSVPTFFRKANKTVEEDADNDGLERNRLWLNVTSAEGAFGQTLLGYMTDASNGLDSADGEYINDGKFALTSLLDSKEYIIQARALPFDDKDIVPMLFKTPNAGDYTITLAEMDGVFADGQAIYIKDNLTNTVNNLNEKPYNFSSEVGEFSARFEVVYNTSSLSTKNPTIDANSIVVYKSNQALNINSGAIAMKSVELYDMSGRVIYKKENIDNTKFVISNMNFQDQIIIVKINTENGIVSKKFSWTK